MSVNLEEVRQRMEAAPRSKFARDILLQADLPELVEELERIREEKALLVRQSHLLGEQYFYATGERSAYEPTQEEYQRGFVDLLDGDGKLPFSSQPEKGAR